VGRAGAGRRPQADRPTRFWSPPPLWGRVRLGGGARPPGERRPPHPPLRGDLPHKGGGENQESGAAAARSPEDRHR
jgi:hypothetical protein